jgi:hypothetical protein|tara:strand:- start:1818 stop:2039 length:222 start_codon:yes stop_codon:yes gene_type:complete
MLLSCNFHARFYSAIFLGESFPVKKWVLGEMKNLACSQTILEMVCEAANFQSSLDFLSILKLGVLTDHFVDGL